MTSITESSDCDALLRPDHTAADFLPLHFTDLHFLQHFNPGGFFPGEVVEFVGPSGSGKTQCLLDVIATCILPDQWNGHRLRGHETGVIVLDLDLRFPVQRLAELVRGRYSRARLQAAADVDSSLPMQSIAGGSVQFEQFDAADVEGLIDACLSRLHLFRCSSTLQLLCTVSALRSLLDVAPCRLIAIDAANAFLIQDRCNTVYGASLRRTLWAQIKHIVESHRLVLFACSAAIFMKGDPAGRDDDWRRIVDHCIYLNSRHAAHTQSDRATFSACCNNKVIAFGINADGIVPILPQ